MHEFAGTSRMPFVIPIICCSSVTGAGVGLLHGECALVQGLVEALSQLGHDSRADLLQLS